MKPTKEQFLAALIEIEQFSAAPAILASAMRLLRDPKSDIGSISALVARDTALAADIIRCANSAYYGGLPSASINEAVQNLGLQQTMHLLSLAVARIVSNRDLGCYGISGADYWAESLFNGLFLQALARQTGEVDPEEAYTIGLLRFIGRLAIDQAIDKMQGRLFWDAAEPIAKWEMDNVGLVQAQAGAILLERWRFPDNFIHAIGGQDDPMDLAPGNWMAEALCFTSRILPQGLGIPFLPAVTPGYSIVPDSCEFMLCHGLASEQIEGMLVSASQEFDRIRTSFGS